MTEWWTGLTFEQQIYYGVAIVATAVVLLQTLLLLFGGDLGDTGDYDMGDASDHPSGLQVLSTRTIAAFFVGFGWTGVIASQQVLSDTGTTVIAALLVGGLFGAVIFFLMRFLHSLRHSGSLNYRNALGEVATVYLPIPAAMSGTGRIQVMVQGRLKVIEATTHHAERIENRSRVRVVDLLDETTLMVEPLDDAETRTEDS